MAGSDNQVSGTFKRTCDAVSACVREVTMLQTIWPRCREDGHGRFHCGPIAGTLIRLTYHLKRARTLYPEVEWIMSALYDAPPDPFAGRSGATYHEIGMMLADDSLVRVATTAKLGCELLDVLEGPDLQEEPLWKSLNDQREQIEAKVCIDRDVGEYNRWKWEAWSEAFESLPAFHAKNLVARIKNEAARGAEASKLSVMAQERAKEPPRVLQDPKGYLFGWREILDALNLKNDQKDRVARLNSENEGPIIIGKKGSPPKVVKAKLLDWWNRLEILFEDQANQQRGKAMEGAAQHDYGREGRVAHEISGGVKKKRKPT